MISLLALAVTGVPDGPLRSLEESWTIEGCMARPADCAITAPVIPADQPGLAECELALPNAYRNASKERIYAVPLRVSARDALGEVTETALVRLSGPGLQMLCLPVVADAGGKQIELQWPNDEGTMKLANEVLNTPESVINKNILGGLLGGLAGGIIGGNTSVNRSPRFLSGARDRRISW